MGSGGDRKWEEATDAQELFAYRYWYTWETAQNWPDGSVVLCRWRMDKEWHYSLINRFLPQMKHIEDGEYLLIDRKSTRSENISIA